MGVLWKRAVATFRGMGGNSCSMGRVRLMSVLLGRLYSEFAEYVVASRLHTRLSKRCWDVG